MRWIKNVWPYSDPTFISVDEKVILDHIIAYFERFGSKSCCFEDLKTYISFLETDLDKSKLFIQAIRETIKVATGKVNV
jgi:N-terminal acetyltransferase B complex non-catalytic subunit